MDDSKLSEVRQASDAPVVGAAGRCAGCHAHRVVVACRCQTELCKQCLTLHVNGCTEFPNLLRLQSRAQASIQAAMGVPR